VWVGAAAVRDLREWRPPVEGQELADYETDVLAGFVLARAWTLTVFFQYLELRYRAELHNLTGRVVECPLDEMNRPRKAVDPQLRIPPSAAEVEQLFAGWREELVSCRKFAPAARNYAAAPLRRTPGGSPGMGSQCPHCRSDLPHHEISHGLPTRPVRAPAVLADWCVGRRGPPRAGRPIIVRSKGVARYRVRGKLRDNSPGLHAPVTPTPPHPRPQPQTLSLGSSPILMQRRRSCRRTRRSETDGRSSMREANQELRVL